MELTLDLLDAGVDVDTSDTRDEVGLRETCDIECVSSHMTTYCPARTCMYTRVPIRNASTRGNVRS